MSDFREALDELQLTYHFSRAAYAGGVMALPHGIAMLENTGNTGALVTKSIELLRVIQSSQLANLDPEAVQELLGKLSGIDYYMYTGLTVGKIAVVSSSSSIVTEGTRIAYLNSEDAFILLVYAKINIKYSQMLHVEQF